MIHKILVEVETEEHITYEDIINAIEIQFFTEGELFNIKLTDAIFTSITKIEEPA